MLHKLILLLKELEKLCSVCNRCGMCQASCPVFLETKHEADVARGKLTLIDGLITEVLTNPEKVLARLNKCLLCGNCASGCSRNVKTLEIFIKTRVIITEYTGLSIIKKILLKTIVARPLVFNKTAILLNKFQNLFFKPVNDNPKAIQSRWFNPFLKNRQITPLSPNSFSSLAGKEKITKNINKDKTSLNVAFFAGCLVDKMMPEVGLSCIKALEHHGVNVSVFKDEGCCGMPALASGDIESFNKLVEHNSDLFSREDFDYIVTACATCTFAINRLWTVMYNGDARSKVESIAEKTIDITQFICSNFTTIHTTDKKNSNDTQAIVTIHDPCHLKKSLNIFQEPRTLLKSNPNYTFQEMNNPDGCCGFGGTFNIDHYELSSKIGAKKCSDIENSNASIVATSCPACIMQLKDQLAKNNKNNIEVKHIMELYAESLK